MWIVPIMMMASMIVMFRMLIMMVVMFFAMLVMVIVMFLAMLVAVKSSCSLPCSSWCSS